MIKIKALEHILRGLKIQGVRKVVLVTDNTNENAKISIFLSGFTSPGRLIKPNTAMS